MATRSENNGRPRVVIVGAGFGGLAAAQALAGAPVDVVVIDRRNYHLFQPLLYQVATAGLSPADIAWPIRSILSRQQNASVRLGRVTGVDLAGRAVNLGRRRVPFDYLVLATGARHAYFGHEEWGAVAPGLKKIADATRIREEILLAFERAETHDGDPSERAALMTFVIVGGGPTGVEMAGAIAELAKKALAKDFRRIDPKSARIILVEAGPRILSAFPERLSAVAKRSLERLGVEVWLGRAVTGCEQGFVMVDDERVNAHTVIWAAGVMASSAAKWLDADHDGAGRVIVDTNFAVPHRKNVFALGDTALIHDANGRLLPGTAPAAKQAGRHVAAVIRRRVLGRADPPPFRYRDAGNLATIGRKAAIVDFGQVRLTGLLAWLLWSVVHIYFLIGLRHRFVVALHWLWNYVTFQRGARLITSGEDDTSVDVEKDRLAS